MPLFRRDEPRAEVLRFADFLELCAPRLLVEVVRERLFWPAPDDVFRPRCVLDPRVLAAPRRLLDFVRDPREFVVREPWPLLEVRDCERVLERLRLDVVALLDPALPDLPRALPLRLRDLVDLALLFPEDALRLDDARREEVARALLLLRRRVPPPAAAPSRETSLLKLLFWPSAVVS